VDIWITLRVTHIPTFLIVIFFEYLYFVNLKAGGLGVGHL